MTHILGPVTSFFITSIQNEKPNVLNAVKKDSGIIYYWESDASALSQITPVFAAVASGDNYIINDSTNMGGIGFRTDGVIGHAETGPAIDISNSRYEKWEDLLSNILYTIKEDGKVSKIFTDSDEKHTIKSDNLMLLPTSWYTHCSSTDPGLKIASAAQSLANWFCVVDSSSSACSAVSETISSGWTTLNECQVGVNYDYCLTGKYCGDSNCNGPCQDSGVCEYESTKYVCMADPQKFKFFTSPIFIAIIFLVFIMGMFVVAFRHTRK